jgi:hypothetical protein
MSCPKAGNSEEAPMTEETARRQQGGDPYGEVEYWFEHYPIMAQVPDISEFMDKETPTDEQAAKIILYLEAAYQAIQNGSAQKWMPIPYGKQYSTEEVDKVIKTIDDYLEWEVNVHAPGYWRGTAMYNASLLFIRDKPIEYPADFNRLQGGARAAFVQGLKRKLEEVFGDSTDD